VIEAYLGTADDEADGRSVADGTLADPTGGSGAAAPGTVTTVDPSAAGTLDLPDTTSRNAP
jgi:branched-chain amino acid transport system permease protein